MSGIEATTELDRLRRHLESVQGGSAIKSERLYELAGTCATLRQRAERAEDECLEQARLNGMGSERELALLARAERAEAGLGLRERGLRTAFTVGLSTVSPEDL